MKTFPIAVLALLPVVSAAAPLSSLAFPEQKIGLPPLSLAQAGSQTPATGPWQASPRVGLLFRAVAKPPKRVSNMPIVVPRENADAKMAKAPDTSTDYKLIVKTPDVEAAGERTGRP